MKTLFAPGFTGPGFIQEILSSWKKLAGYWIFTPKSGRVDPLSKVIMSSPLMKRPVSRPEFVGIPLLLHIPERE